MILADKIIVLRKEKEWSQEQLAEKLGVSRQAVSKWESAAAIPDLDKLLKMSDLFGVSVDYLVKDQEAEAQYELKTTDESDIEYVRVVSMEEADKYMNTVEEISPKIATGVSMCIASPIVLLVLLGISEACTSVMSENMAILFGVVVLLCMVSAAVAMFIIFGMRVSKYEFLAKEAINLAYGIRGIVEKKKAEMERGYYTCVTVGVVLCILSALPLIVAAMMDCNDMILLCAVGFLLFIVSVAVNLFVRQGMIWGSYLKLLQEGEYSVTEKALNKSMDPISGVYWCLITAAFMIYSFLTNDWNRSWIVWPVAGVIYGGIAAVYKARKR